MEKKIKFSDNPNFSKTIYGIIIAALCITAIVIGIVAANNRTDDTLPEDPPVTDNQPSDQNPPADENPGETPPEQTEKKPEKKSFLAPVSGSVSKPHSLTTPVFSTTLEEWRIHTGIDISTEDNASVFAAFDGEVTEVYDDSMLGYTVVVDHGSDVKSIYSNLENNDLLAKVGAKVSAGDIIGTVGDSAISELAEEPHLHFEITLANESVDPLEYFSDESKSSSLGISD